jgi:hypothetical protein
MFMFCGFLFGTLVGWFVCRFGTRLIGITNAAQHKLGKKLEEIEKEMKE